MKSLHLYLLVLMTCTLCLVACEDDDSTDNQMVEDTAQVNLDFRAMFGDEPLRYNTILDLNGTAIDFRESAFFISDVYLHGDTSSALLTRNDYVEYAGNPGMEVTASLSYDEVPVGEYHSVSFYIGIPADLDAMSPTDFPTSDPKSDPSKYWSAWEGYIYSQLEGFIDAEGDGEPMEQFVYHSGTQGVYFRHEFTIDGGLVVSSDEGAANQVTLSLDHLDLLRDGEGYLDILSDPVSHGTSPYIQTIMNNFGDAFSVQ